MLLIKYIKIYTIYNIILNRSKNYKNLKNYK